MERAITYSQKAGAHGTLDPVSKLLQLFDCLGLPLAGERQSRLQLLNRASRDLINNDGNRTTIKRAYLLQLNKSIPLLSLRSIRERGPMEVFEATAEELPAYRQTRQQQPRNTHAGQISWTYPR